MPVRRKPKQRAVRWRPPMPPELVDPPTPDVPMPRGDDLGEVWATWEAAHASAYRTWEAERTVWLREFGGLPSREPAPVGDEPFCGEFGPHGCAVAGCVEARG